MPVSTPSRYKGAISFVIGIALLLILLLAAAYFVPLYETRGEYCLYCGQMSDAYRILDLTLWRQQNSYSLYHDTIAIPAHVHSQIGMDGYRYWLYSDHQHWDEFGFTGTPCRDALVRGIQQHPGRQSQIMQEFMSLTLRDEPARLRFIISYGDSESVRSAQFLQQFRAIPPGDTLAFNRLLISYNSDIASASDSAIGAAQ